MTIAEFIARLSKAEGFERGGELRAVGEDQLEYVGPPGLLRHADRDFIRRHKDGILAWLRTPAAALPVEELALYDCAPYAFGPRLAGDAGAVVADPRFGEPLSQEDLDAIFDDEEITFHRRVIDQALALAERARAKNVSAPEIASQIRRAPARDTLRQQGLIRETDDGCAK